jgi:hypothetical protein
MLYAEHAYSDTEKMNVRDEKLRIIDPRDQAREGLPFSDVLTVKPIYPDKHFMFSTMGEDSSARLHLRCSSKRALLATHPAQIRQLHDIQPKAVSSQAKRSLLGPFEIV